MEVPASATRCGSFTVAHPDNWQANGSQDSVTIAPAEGLVQGNVGYDAGKDEWVDMVKAGIIDPAKVTRSRGRNNSGIQRNSLRKGSVPGLCSPPTGAVAADSAPPTGTPLNPESSMRNLLLAALLSLALVPLIRFVRGSERSDAIAYATVGVQALLLATSAGAVLAGAGFLSTLKIGQVTIDPSEPGRLLVLMGGIVFAVVVGAGEGRRAGTMGQIALFGIADVAMDRVGELSYGDQKLVAIARLLG